LDRLVIWEGIDAKRWEVARVELLPNGLRAAGTQVGTDPTPYRLDYNLDAADRFITRLLDLRVVGSGWSRALRLEHDGRGKWRASIEHSGTAPLGPPSASTNGLSDARDCDLGYSPLTNLLPVRRFDLIAQPGAADIVTAWVSIPDFVLQPYPQRYEHVAVTAGGGAIVRFVDRGLSPGFTADLELDSDGVVDVYPQLAHRVHPTQ
jgi:hypothetical protein